MATIGTVDKQMVFHENVLRISSFLDWKAIRMAGVICKSWRFGAMNRWPLNEVVLDRWTQWDERNTKKPSFIKKWSEIRTALRQDRIRSVHIIRNIHGHLEPSEQEQERQILSIFLDAETVHLISNAKQLCELVVAEQSWLLLAFVLRKNPVQMPLISETSAFKLDEIDGFDDNYSLPVPAQFVNAATIGFTLLLAPSLRRLRTNTMDIFMGLVPRVFPNLRELEFEYNCDDGPLPRFFPSRSQCPVLAHFVVTDAYCSDIESILDWCPPNVTLHVLLSDEDDTSPFPVSESLPHSFSLMKRTIVILENRCCRPQIELETARNYLQWCVSDLDVAVTLDFQSQICHSCEIGADTSSECSERESEESNKSSKRKRRKRRKTGRKQVRDREERRKASMARKEKYNGVHKKKEEGRLNVRTSKTRNIAKSRRDDDDEEDEEEAQVLKEMRDAREEERAQRAAAYERKNKFCAEEEGKKREHLGPCRFTNKRHVAACKRPDRQIFRGEEHHVIICSAGCRFMYHGTCWRRSKRHATSSVGEKCSGGSCDGNIISITWVDKSNGSKVETKSTIGEASQEEESQEENKASELKESETTIGVVVSPKIVVVDAIRHADNVLIGYTSPLRFEAPVFTPKIRELVPIPQIRAVPSSANTTIKPAMRPRRRIHLSEFQAMKDGGESKRTT